MRARRAVQTADHEQGLGVLAQLGQQVGASCGAVELQARVPVAPPDAHRLGLAKVIADQEIHLGLARALGAEGLDLEPVFMRQRGRGRAGEQHEGQDGRSLHGRDVLRAVAAWPVLGRVCGQSTPDEAGRSPRPGRVAGVRGRSQVSRTATERARSISFPGARRDHHGGPGRARSSPPRPAPRAFRVTIASRPRCRRAARRAVARRARRGHRCRRLHRRA